MSCDFARGLYDKYRWNAPEIRQQVESTPQLFPPCVSCRSMRSGSNEDACKDPFIKCAKRPRQDLWRALRSSSGFAPFLQLEPCYEEIEIADDGRECWHASWIKVRAKPDGDRQAVRTFLTQLKASIMKRGNGFYDLIGQPKLFYSCCSTRGRL